MLVYQNTKSINTDIGIDIVPDFEIRHPFVMILRELLPLDRVQYRMKSSISKNCKEGLFEGILTSGIDIGYRHRELYRRFSFDVEKHLQYRKMAERVFFGY
jgi:hypothetical protein